MSGPKVSSYELEQRQRERLRRERQELERIERERRERLRREREERERRERERRRVEALRQTLTKVWGQIDTCAKGCNEFVQGLDESRYDASAFREYAREVEACRQKYGNLNNICGHGTEAEVACETALNQILLRGREMEKMAAMLHQTRLKDQHEMATRMLQEYRQRRQAPADKPNKEWGEKAEALFRELMAKLSEIEATGVEQERVEAGKTKLKQYRQEWAAQPEQLHRKLHEFQIDTLQHLVSDVKQTEFRRNVRERYESLCAVANVTPLQYDDAYAVTIEHACGALETALDEHRGKAYVRQAIQESMEELGYHLVGERGDQGQDPTIQYLYRVTGTENVLRVTCSAGGQTIIEIGKGDNVSRVAEPREVDKLVGDMQAFCANGFPAILQRLREKGVYLNEDEWLPPVAECAQIIDMTPFMREESRGSLQMVYDQIVTRELMAATIE